ncbi:hypothetical protein [Actinomadura macra]|uniref:hypothetical protein n=1 Tax=Actinomadura macra TaxID=46164 RepID=UPI00082DD1F1|nr:hypothetical protein [Actinomadura macra]
MTTTTGRPPASTPKKKVPARSAGGAAPTRTAPAKTAPTKKPAPDKPEPAKTVPKAAPKPETRKAAPKKAVPKKAAPSAARKAGRTAGHAPPRTPFVLLIVGLLGGALVSLLLLNTVLAKDAFTLTRLQQSNKMLEQQRQAYEEEIAREDSPQSIANKARGLGMRPREGMAFVNGDTGQTSGPRLRPVPHSAAASAGAASVLGIPGTVVPGDPRAHGAPAGTGAP